MGNRNIIPRAYKLSPTFAGSLLQLFLTIQKLSIMHTNIWALMPPYSTSWPALYGVFHSCGVLTTHRDLGSALPGTNFCCRLAYESSINKEFRANEKYNSNENYLKFLLSDPTRALTRAAGDAHLPPADPQQHHPRLQRQQQKSLLR